MQKKITTTKKRTVTARIARGLGIFLLSLVGLVVLLLILIQTAPVQDFGRKKIVSFLENKLKTKVAIKRLDIDFPKMLVLEGVYIEDRTKDTLISGNQLKVDIDMFKLLSSDIQINEINLSGITLKIKRQLPDTIFNYQFIADAFASQDTTTKKDTAALKMAIDKIIVDKTRLVFFDVVTGNDVDVYLNHFDTRIKTFDLNNLRYDVPRIVVNGVKGRINQTKPIEVTAVVNNPNPAVKNEAPKYLNFTNEEILLQDVDLSYSNAVSAMSTRFAMKDLTIHPENFDLKNTAVSIKDIELNNLDGYLRMGASTTNAPVVKLTNEKNQQVANNVMPWLLRIGSIKLNNNNFAFDDNTKPRMSRGMDYGHMAMQNLTLHEDNFFLHNDTIATNIVKGQMTERRGFVLNELRSDIVYTDKGASLKNLYIKTPGSEIKRSIEVHYPSIATIQQNMNLVQLNVNVDNSYLSVKDILTFAPQLASQPAFRNPAAKIFVNTQMRGTLNRLVIDRFQFRGLQNTNIDVAGVVNNATDANNVSADLAIRSFNTSRTDIVSITPPGTIPKNITVPENISANGRIKGSMKDMYADLAVNTSLGAATVRGTVSNAADKINARYNADISTRGLNIGAITQQRQNLGAITAAFKINGRGYDPERTNATVKGTVYSAEVMKYTYHNLALNATMANQKFNANASIKDPNIHLAVVAQGNLGGNLPGFTVTANIDSIKTLPLHLTPDAIIYRGKITAKVPEFNMDALNGEVNITNSVLVMNGQRIAMDTVTAVAKYANGEQAIAVKSDFLNAVIQGKYKLAQLGDIFIDAIQPYYAINTTGKPLNVDPYSFTLNAYAVDHPTLHAFIPDLKRFDGLTLNSTFSSSDGINANVSVPHVVMGTNTIDSLTLTAVTTAKGLSIVSNVEGIASGTSFALYGTRVTANVANNKIDFGILLRDRAAKPKYQLAGLFSQEPNNTFAISLRPDSLLLNYKPWSISGNNVIRFGNNVLNATNFDLSSANQHLIINSVGSAPNSPLQVTFNSFQLATLTAFVQTDSLLADGTLNGNVEVRNVMQQPAFVADLNINNLALKRDTVGDVNIKVNNNTPDVYAANVTVTGRGNDVNLTGNYFMKPGNASTMDFNLAIRKLPFKTVEAFSMGALQNATGDLTGNVAIKGAVTKPDIDGTINFRKAGFTPTMLGSYFTINNESIKVNSQGVAFDKFTIKDSANNPFTIDGLAGTTNFTNYNFDLSIRAKNFRAINTTKRQNSMYYGQLYFSTNMNIKGTETAPVVDGNLTVEESTNLAVVLPQAEPGVVDRKGVIEFVDMDAPGSDSLFQAALARYDSSFNRSNLVGFDVSVNIHVVKQANFNMVIDEANGDFVNLQGEALLNGGIDPSGKVTLTGTYELEKGGYELSFNFLRRRFDIQKGSKITWTGEPTTANMDVTAVYVANTSAIDLVQNQLNDNTKGYYQQKLPFQVLLKLQGELMKPVLTFDIQLPTENNARVSNEVLTTVNTRLDQVRQEPSELNKQVFALLLLNRFVSENPFESSGGGGGFSAGSYARQSVSKIMTEQLNKLASDLISGVDITFDVNSAEDYTTGERRDRTDFNVQLSKRLLNDRLKVSVGSNYELEGPQPANNQGGSNVIGNITVDYNLTQDGRYMIRGYRKNDFDAVIEGIVVETGLKFIISVDYNKFREIFQKKRVRKPKDQAPKNDNIAAQTDKPTAQNNAPAPANQNKTVSTGNAIVADDRKIIPAPENEPTDEN